MSPPVLIVSEQLNYIKPDGIHAIFMPVIIEFSRCIRTYSSAKFEIVIIRSEYKATIVLAGDYELSFRILGKVDKQVKFDLFQKRGK